MKPETEEVLNLRAALKREAEVRRQLVEALRQWSDGTFDPGYVGTTEDALAAAEALEREP